MILYICYHNPFGTRGGGAIASHAYLRAFAEICNGELDLMCSSELRGQVCSDINYNHIYFAPERSKLQKIFSILTGHMNRYVSTVKELLSQKPYTYNLVVFDHSNIAGPLVEFVNKFGVKTVTIHHNYEKEYFSDNNHGFYRHFFLHHVIRWEKIAYKKSSLNLFLTKHDMNTFSRVYGLSMGKNIVIGAFEYHDYKAPKIHPRKDNRLTFVITGSLGNYQTIDAICYFFTELYPYMPNDCKILVSGRNPSFKVIEICRKFENVVLIPDPSDMNEVVSLADIYICATRIGGGLKLRLMDGLKNGLPVITHACSARGFDIFENLQVFKVYNNPKEFGNKLSELLNIHKTGSVEKRIVMNLYKEYFSYEAGVRRLKKIIMEFIDKHHFA